MKLHPDQTFCFMDYETTDVDTNINTKDLPIQIGCVFTDSKFKVLEEYSNYIKWFIFAGLKNWDLKPEWKTGYKYHKIEVSDINKKGKIPEDIKIDLIAICNKIQKNNRKPIIISDAPNFEMFWTKYIFRCPGDDFPFHYNAWCLYPMLFFYDDLVDFSEKPHDALADARIMHDQMLTVYNHLKRRKK